MLFRVLVEPHLSGLYQLWMRPAPRDDVGGVTLHTRAVSFTPHITSVVRL